MATSATVVTGLLPSVLNNTVDLTESGFGTVDAAIIISSNANSTNNPQTDGSISIGFWDGTNSNCSSTYTNDNQTTSDTSRTNQSAVISHYDGSTELARATIAGITDGIRLTLTVDNTGNQRYITAILFSGLLNESVGSALISAATGVDVTAPGFKPDLVFFHSTAYDVQSPANAAQAILSFGVAHNNSSNVVSQRHCGISSFDGQSTTITNSYISSDSCVGQIFNDSLSWKAAAKDFDSSGFTLDPTTSTPGDYVYYLALELADPDDAFVTSIDSRTTTGTQATTGAGFSPDVVGFISSVVTALDTVTQKSSMQIGAGTSTVERSLAVHDEDAVSTTNSNSEANLTNVIQLLDDDGTDEVVASIDSIDSDGWTLDYTTVPGTAVKIIAFAVGDSTASGTKTGTGALSAQASAISGVGEITHTGTGALSAQASAISGAGTVSGAVTGTGSLSSQASAISGVGEIAHTGTGALSSQASVISGAGTVGNIAVGTGALAAQSVTISGVGEITHTGTGALASQASVVSGDGVVTGTLTGTGALSSQVSTISGDGIVLTTLTGTGALSAQDSAILGAGSLLTTITGTGALSAQAAAISGSDAGIWTAIPKATTTWTQIT